jgi:hypothetical protein
MKLVKAGGDGTTVLIDGCQLDLLVAAHEVWQLA